MTKISCINKKASFRNLTINKEYDGIKEGDNYVVTNDAGLRATYAARYFREEPVNIQLSQVIAVTISRANDNLDVIIVINNSGELRERVSLNIQRAHISCGIMEISNISSLNNTLENLYDDLPDDYVGMTEEEFFRYIWAEIFAYIVAQYPSLLYLISDVVSEDNEVLRAVLDDAAGYSIEGTNPNSHNEICMWVLNNNR